MSVDLSVVIITHNKAKEIGLVLRSLELQRNDLACWELIVVDDASTDGTIDCVNKFAGSLPLKIVKNAQNTKNRSYNRNSGLAQCTGKRVVFLDGDTVPVRSFLKSHAAYSTRKIVGLGQRLNLTRNLTEEQIAAMLQGDTIFALPSLSGLADEREPHFCYKQCAEQPHRWRFMFGHNFSAPLDCLRHVGGSDETLIYWGTEDLELGYRLYKFGLNFVYDPGCGGTHLPHPSSQNAGYETNLTLFYKKFPNPEIELMFIEYRLSPPACYQAFANCNREGIRLSIAEKVLRESGFTPETTLLVCIDIDDKRYCSTEGMGIVSVHKEKHFKNAVCSAGLASLGDACLMLIFDLLRESADRVFIYDPDQRIGHILEEIVSRSARRAFYRNGDFWEYRRENTDTFGIHFQRVDTGDSDLSNFKYIPLVNFLQPKVPDTHMIRPYGSIISDDTYCSLDHSCLTPDHILNNNTTFVFHQTWDKHLAQKYPDGRSVYWYDLPNADPGYIAMLDNVYDALIFQTPAQDTVYRRVSGKKPSCTIEPYVDTSLFHPRHRERSEKFSISLIGRNAHYADFHHILIEAFRDEFADENDVLLNLYYGQPVRVRFNSPYMGEMNNRKLECWLTALNHLYHGYVDRLVADYSDTSGKIRIIDKNLSPTELADAIHFSDAVMILRPNWLAVAPLACGKPLIATDADASSYTFFDNDLVSTVATIPHSGLMLDINLIPLGTSSTDQEFNFIRMPDTTSFRTAIRSLYESWKAGASKALPDNHADFARRYSVESAAEKLCAFLSGLQ